MNMPDKNPAADMAAPMIKLEPALDWILLEPVVKRERTDGGLFLPDTARQEKQIESATVHAVGPDCKVTEPGMTAIYDTRIAKALDMGDSGIFTLVRESMIMAYVSIVDAAVEGVVDQGAEA